MVPKDADNRYDDLLSGGVPAASEDYSLEEILAEFGAGEEQRLLRGTEAEETPPSAPPQPRQREAAPAQAPAQPRRKEAAPAVPAQPEPPEAELPPAAFPPEPEAPELPEPLPAPVQAARVRAMDRDRAAARSFFNVLFFFMVFTSIICPVWA